MRPRAPVETDPERLHKFFALNVPAIFHVFWSAIRPFIDPVTREKIVFVRGTPEQQRTVLEETFDLAQLEEALGGSAPFSWEPDAYFARDTGLSLTDRHSPPAAPAPDESVKSTKPTETTEALSETVEALSLGARRCQRAEGGAL